MVDQGDFRPDHEAAFVGQVVVLLVVLVMRHPDRGGADLGDEVEVLGVVGVVDGPAFDGAVLVQVDAVQAERRAVQVEAGGGVYGDASQT